MHSRYTKICVEVGCDLVYDVVKLRERSETQKMNPNTNRFESKSQLAKLLAVENINMRHDPSAVTAYFDIKERVLVLPVWENISVDLYDMLVVHEVGHALDTDMKKWIAAIETISEKFLKKPSSGIVKDYLNVVEDARIDKLQKRRYPGSRINYVRGYKELHDRDFFKLKDKNVNKLTFIDRANIYFKGGYGMGISFSAAEKAFIKRMEDAETFEDVIKITTDVFEYALTVEKENRKNESAENDQNQGEGEGSGNYDNDGDYEYGDDDEYDNDDDSDADDEGSDDAQTLKSGVNNYSDVEETDVPRVETEEAARQNQKQIVGNSNTEYVYFDIPVIDTNSVIHDYPVFVAEAEEYLVRVVREATINHNLDFVSSRLELLKKNLNQWKQKERDAISFMINSFEMKKAADSYLRTSVAKTGVIDTNKLHSYKYNDDLFLRQTNVRAGKNHGFVMFLDWSASMHGNIARTLFQLYTFAMFCRKLQVPFEVYTFRSLRGNEKSKTNGSPAPITSRHPAAQAPALNAIDMHSFRLRNVLSSRMSLNTFNRAMELLFIVAQHHDTNCPDPMGGTPLNQALLAAEHVVKKFQKETKVQIANVIILTDGDSDPVEFKYKRVSYGKTPVYVINDPVTKQTYYLNATNMHKRITETFAKVLRDRTKCTILGFFLADRYLNYKYLIRTNVIPPSMDTPDNRKSWEDDNFVSITSAGYDEYFVIASNTESKAKLPSGKTSVKELTKAFIAESNKKTSNRVLLARFIDRITKEFSSKKSA
jgi:hypothetical protein